MSGRNLLFIDESGDSNLKANTQHFVLSSVLIYSEDFQIIDGYLRLLKRKFFQDDDRILHAVDLFEDFPSKYPELVQGNRSKATAFITQLSQVLSNIPFNTGLYYVDKDKLKAANPEEAKLNKELPYERCGMEAINDFTNYLTSNNSTGELMIESRLFKDKDFVGYFDQARKVNLPNNQKNTFAMEVQKRITCLTIASKGRHSVGLELADLCAYVVYRKTYGDPNNKMKLEMRHILEIFNKLKAAVYVKGPGNRAIKDLS